ncbi:metallopeptidase family protein [Corynebacterium sp. SCR221107]|uniref:metallopeptidase family protein n=1 Tax=Corynebacterium sp. SCR221107 TaxID=3017361 RepID=UPI0022EC78F3|nr:metallopeptidase family protein [Corynebacterium sp. SCR221107]WBT09334.1 metallopeptidase family protein [Corynebacterium sp. SCR221107]
MHTRSFRDRHGRGIRGPLLPASTPRFRSRRQLFDAAVLEAYAPIQQRFAAQLEHLDIAVDTIPRMRLTGDSALLPDEVTADGPVPLGRVLPAAVDPMGNPTRARIVLFRMPIEQRCVSVQERQDLLSQVLTSLVATYLNIAPEDIDPDFDK